MEAAVNWSSMSCWEKSDMYSRCSSRDFVKKLQKTMLTDISFMSWAQACDKNMKAMG